MRTRNVDSTGEIAYMAERLEKHPDGRGVRRGLAAAGLGCVFLGVNIGFAIAGTVSFVSTALSGASSIVLIASGIYASKRACHRE